MRFKETGNYIYKYDVRDKINQKVKELKEQGYKKYCPNIYNNGSIWRNEKTGEYIDIRYGYGTLIIEQVERISENELYEEKIKKGTKKQ